MSDAILAGLDPEQRAVAESLDGPVVVLAGAGSGKTRAITHRIAYGVATGRHEARRTLAVTFTTRAAGEMRDRLRTLGVEGVQVRTFHAAALRQLRYFLGQRNGAQVPELIPSKARLVAEAARRCGLPTDTATVRDMASALELLVLTDFSQRPVPDDAEPWRSQVGALYKAYAQVKDERNVFDYEDILLSMTRLLETQPAVADEVRANYRWFTVDEYQDINPLQQKLLRLWLGERDDLCVVGDANQTIYSFAGATPRYLTGFRTDFSDATEIRLERCYRSTPQVVTMANAVISAGPRSPASLVLSSQREAGPAPTVEVCVDDVAEAADVAARIRRLLDEGRPARDIAVLYRINRQSEPLEEALAEAGVPALLRGTERFFDRPEVREAVTRLRGAARAGASGALSDEVRAVLGVMGWTPEAPRSAGAVRDRWESLSALATLAEELGPGLGGDLAAFVGELDQRAELQHAPIAEGVTLATIHAAKGLEWPVVFVVGCSDDLLPFDAASTAEQVEEERRLFYVAITRAADELHLSWARARQPGGRRFRVPSRFLEDAVGGRVAAGGEGAGVVRRGSGRVRSERSHRGPARCRVCRKGLVTAQERTLGRCQSCPADLNADLLDALRAWRLDVSRERGVPAYVVFTDVTLMAVAEQLPMDEEALADIPGIGPMKLQAYGEDVLGLVRTHA